MFPRAFAHVRALLVTAHVVAIALFALPAPEGAMDRSMWREPTVQVEFQTWSRWLGMTPARFEDWLWGLASGYMDVRARALEPLGRYIDTTGALQPWRLFVAPHRFPARYQVQLLRAGQPNDAWETVFEERSSTATWHEPFFAHERMRSAMFRFSWPQFATMAHQLCRYNAAGMFRERADAAALRCRFYKARLPTPLEARVGIDPPGEWVNVSVVARGSSGS